MSRWAKILLYPPLQIFKLFKLFKLFDRLIAWPGARWVVEWAIGPVTTFKWTRYSSRFLVIGRSRGLVARDRLERKLERMARAGA